jgi:hypothetical protein
MDILFDHLGRKLDCECQILYDERELRKEALERQFGVDFERREVGLLDLDRICRTVFGCNAEWNSGFCGQMTGCLDFRVEKVFGVMDRKVRASVY